MLLQSLKRFLFVGGMPEVVAAAANGATLLDLFALQDDLLKAYRDDFAKYGRIDPCFRSLHQILEENDFIWSAKAEKFLLEHAKPI